MTYFEPIFEIANRIQTALTKQGIEQSQSKQNIPRIVSLVELYDSLIVSPILIESTRELFIGGHYSRAVEEAFKCLNNSVKEKSKVHDKDGQDLMNHVFSPKKPILKLSNLKTTSDNDKQLGYMMIFGGSMTGIRNPRAHDHRLHDSVEDALEMLVLANHLMNRLDKATRVRKR